MRLALTWLASLIVFLALDTVWLGVVGGSLYTSVLGDIMLNGFRIVPAVLFYALHITGILVFVLPLARRHGGISAAIAYGAMAVVANPVASNPRNAVRIATLNAFIHTMPAHPSPEQTNGDTG